MKVLNLRCPDGHAFEGWFASEDDFQSQQARGLITCPSCGHAEVQRMPSAPRLNLSHARPPAEAPAPASPSSGNIAPAPTDLSDEVQQAAQAIWLQTVREVLKHTEDVGDRFPDEVRRMHYGETEARGIRGQASAEEREALSEEGIEVVALPIPKGLDGPTH